MIRIRAALPSDYATFTKLFVELAVDDPVLDEARFVRDIVPSMLVAEDERAHPIGYAYFQTFDDVTHVRHVVSAPDARRRGVGRALMMEVARIARDKGCTSWRLNAKPTNAVAIALYESLGFVRMFASRSLTLPWSAVDSQPVHALDVTTREARADEDVRIESAMSLPSGQLAADRARARVAVIAEEENAVVGVAVFDAKFPGAFPFRVARTELAIPLLRGVRALAPQGSLVHLTAENQPEVTDMLIGLGAKVRLDIVHMRGPLPAA